MDLVSNKFFKLIGDSMVSFRKKLIESEIPASLPAVVKKVMNCLILYAQMMLKKKIIKTCLTTYSKVK